jgi:hypothetical protein
MVTIFFTYVHVLQKAYKNIYSKRFVGILDDKIDMLNIYINQILEIEKTVVTSTFCKTSVCLMLQTLRYIFEI